MESRRRSESQQVWDLRSRVGLEVIAMPEFMMRGEKPPRIWFDALQRANVVFKIDMEAVGVRVFLPLGIRRNREQIRFFPETLRQRREPEPSVKLLRGFDDPFRFSAFEILVDVCCFNKAGPLLCPAIAYPVRRNFLRHRLMKFFGELVFRPGM